MEVLDKNDKIRCEKCGEIQEDLACDYVLHESFGYSPQKHDCWNCSAVFWAARKLGAITISFE